MQALNRRCKLSGAPDAPRSPRIGKGCLPRSLRFLVSVSAYSHPRGILPYAGAVEERRMSAVVREQMPNETLSAIIVEALQRAGLVPEGVIQDLQEKLAAGTAREADWRAWIGAAAPVASG